MSEERTCDSPNSQQTSEVYSLRKELEILKNRQLLFMAGLLQSGVSVEVLTNAIKYAVKGCPTSTLLKSQSSAANPYTHSPQEYRTDWPFLNNQNYAKYTQQQQQPQSPNSRSFMRQWTAPSRLLQRSRSDQNPTLDNKFHDQNAQIQNFIQQDNVKSFAQTLQQQDQYQYQHQQFNKQTNDQNDISPSKINSQKTQNLTNHTPSISQNLIIGVSETQSELNTKKPFAVCQQQTQQSTQQQQFVNIENSYNMEDDLLDRLFQDEESTKSVWDDGVTLPIRNSSSELCPIVAPQDSMQLMDVFENNSDDHIKSICTHPTVLGAKRKSENEPILGQQQKQQQQKQWKEEDYERQESNKKIKFQSHSSLECLQQNALR